MTITRTKYGIKDDLDDGEEMVQRDPLEYEPVSEQPQGTGLGMGDSLQSRSEIPKPPQKEDEDLSAKEPSMFDGVIGDWRERMAKKRQVEDMAMDGYKQIMMGQKPTEEQDAAGLAHADQALGFATMGVTGPKKPLVPKKGMIESLLRGGKSATPTAEELAAKAAAQAAEAEAVKSVPGLGGVIGRRVQQGEKAMTDYSAADNAFRSGQSAQTPFELAIQRQKAMRALNKTEEFQGLKKMFKRDK